MSKLSKPLVPVSRYSLTLMYSNVVKSNVHSVLVNWVLGIQLALIIRLVPLAHGQDRHLAQYDKPEPARAHDAI